MRTKVVYLLHFSRPYRHARHYLGSCVDLEGRLAQHAAGSGARLVEVIVSNGISFELVRTWRGGRRKERSLKKWHSGVRLCPLCQRKVERSGHEGA